MNLLCPYNIMIGKVLDGRFRILKSLGEGLCSHVYLVEDLQFTVANEETEHQGSSGPEELHFQLVSNLQLSSS